VTTQDLEIGTFFLLNERAGVREHHNKLAGGKQPLQLKSMYSLNYFEDSEDENHNTIYEETEKSITDSERLIQST
jgi:hypothetical protein